VGWWWRYASRDDRRRRSSFITSVVTSIKRHILGAHIVLFNDQVTKPASTKGQCGFPFPFFFMLRVIGRLKIFPTTKGGTSREGFFALEMKKEQKKKTVKGNV
jgi:hypothetical protein